MHLPAQPSTGLNREQFNEAVVRDRLISAQRFLPISARWAAFGLLVFAAYDWFVVPELNGKALCARLVGALLMLSVSIPIKRGVKPMTAEVLLCLPPILIVTSVALAASFVQRNAQDYIAGIALMFVTCTIWVIRIRTYFIVQCVSLAAIAVMFWSADAGHFRNIMISSVFAIFCGLIFADFIFRMHRRALRLQYELKTESRTDALTHLPNRRAFFELAENAAKRAKRRQQGFAMLIIDADHFKSVNDRFGHDVGDAVLQSLAAVIANAVGTPAHCARLGGEEFAVLLSDELAWEQDAAGSLKIAEQIIQATRTHHWANEQLPAMTVSIGVAFQVAPDSMAEIMHQADTALYQAKDAGRDQALLFQT